MSRRNRGCLSRLVIVVGTMFVLVAAVMTGGFAFAWATAAVDTTGEVEFSQPLAIPPLAPSTVDADGRRVFSLTAEEGTSDLGGSEPSATWGFNGAYLGPTLRAERGEHVLVRVRNTLREPTSVHWHGMHLPAAMDGGPHQMVDPGETWSPTWEVDQPATTLWYHPHPHGQTADHVSRGLAGMFIVDDDEERRLALPRTYGVDDLPVIVQDKDVRGNGNLGNGMGKTVLANGTPGAYADVTTERVRLRLLNGSSMRVFDFRLDNAAQFDLIATDGGLLPHPLPSTHVRLSPGERAEIVVAMRPGERRVLRSVKPDLGGNLISDHFEGGGDSFDILQLRAGADLQASPPVPATLSTSNLETAGDESSVARTRSFSLGGRSINGRSMDLRRIDGVVNVGDTEVWEVVNEGGSSHSFHVHDVQFRVVSADGEAPPPELAGLKDTVYLTPNVRYRLLMRFADYADADTPYMFHCHLLRHEDEGMMGQFVVVEPGAEPGTIPAPEGGGADAHAGRPHGH